jgi:hypothetical protein
MRMSKAKNRVQLPTVDEAAIAVQEQASEQLADRAASAAASVARAPLAVSAGRIEVPLVRQEFSYLVRRCDVTKMTRTQSQGWRELLEGLQAGGVRLANGQRVTKLQHAIKYVGEQLAVSEKP